jgi:hypothetical protein
MATVDCVKGPPPPRSALELSVFDPPGNNDVLEKEKEIGLIITFITSSSSFSSSYSSSPKKVKFNIVKLMYLVVSPLCHGGTAYAGGSLTISRAIHG